MAPPTLVLCDATDYRSDHGRESMSNVEVVRELYRLFGERNEEGLRRLFAPGIEWVQMEGFPGGGRYVGADAVLRDVFAGFREEWEGWRAVVDRYLDAGESVVALGHYEGAYKPTNRPTRAEFAHLYELEDGRIRRFIRYTDTLLLAEATDRSPTTSGERTGSLLRRGS
jgi:ketosteroid isomerase-like protein